jgi:hypothetical protein
MVAGLKVIPNGTVRRLPWRDHRSCLSSGSGGVVAGGEETKAEVFVQPVNFSMHRIAPSQDVVEARSTKRLPNEQLRHVRWSIYGCYFRFAYAKDSGSNGRMGGLTRTGAGHGVVLAAMQSCQTR